MTFWILTIITALMDATAIIMARQYMEKKDRHFLLLALGAWAGSAYFYIKMLAFAVTAIVNIIFVGFSAIIVTTVCYILFKEKVTLGQACGIVLILIGASLL